MYCCTDCKAEFEYVEIVFETHGLSAPPYERIKRCPFCHSADFSAAEVYHCHFCGSRLKGRGKYCSERCRHAGEAYFTEQKNRREIFKNSPVAAAVREVTEYNRLCGTKYSYGQYFMLKGAGKI